MFDSDRQRVCGHLRPTWHIAQDAAHAAALERISGAVAAPTAEVVAAALVARRARPGHCPGRPTGDLASVVPHRDPLARNRARPARNRDPSAGRDASCTGHGGGARANRRR
uniref:hypothetical protein n=1 Tax=Mycobacterium sp. P7213 TaxID=2478465 RepID=UPI0013DE047B|nr:hypothetical protein [Mycobacterium sp. P7213]